MWRRRSSTIFDAENRIGAIVSAVRLPLKESTMTFMRRRKSSSILLISIAAFAFASLPVQAQSNPTDGAALFKTKCAMCHGPDGAGKTPMGQKLNIRDLRSAEVQKQSDADLTHVIGHGKGKMPAFGKSLNEDQIKLLVAHIRELGKK
jgi:mono/diheme cytochrome c family protein